MGTQIGTNQIKDEAVINAKLAGSVPARTNLLVNGGFEVWQRGTGAFTAHVSYFADRWRIVIGGTSTFSISRDTANKDSGSAYDAAVTYTHNAASYVEQILEDYTQLQGKTITLSVRVKTSTASAVKIGIWDGTTDTLSSYHTGGGSYETMTVTATIPSNATTVKVRVWCYASCTAYLDNAMLVIGSVAADYVPLHPADEMARCQRYYEVHGGVANTIDYKAYASGAYTLIWYFPFSTRKGGTPTVNRNGTWTVSNCGQPGADQPSPGGCRLAVTASGTGMAEFVTDSADDTITAEWNP